MPHSTRERPAAIALGALFLLHILLYIWLVPPWQHYDEPTHLEYALLIRDLGRLPTHDEQIPELRRTIAASMLAHGFYQNPDLPLTAPDLDDPDLSLGINERGHPPLYYALVALATQPWRGQPIEPQLYAARGVGLAMGALLFAAAWGALRLLLGGRWQLRCAVLAALALQPALADNMSGVNSDVLASPVAALVLLAALAATRRPGWRTALLCALVLLLAWNVKRTLLLYSLVIPLAWLGVAPALVRRAALGACAAAAVAALAWLVAQPWPLADWQGSAAALTRHAPAAYSGGEAFALAQGEQLNQQVYPYRLGTLDARALTVSAWVWAERPLEAQPLALHVGDQSAQPTVALGPEWRLVSATLELAENTQPVAIALRGADMDVMLQIDGVALTGGAAPLADTPAPDGVFEPGLLDAAGGPNLARNPEAERRIVPLPAPLARRAERSLGQAGLAQTLSSLGNWRWVAAVYPRQLWLLLIGSWGIFGWGQYAVGPGWFTPLVLLVLLALLGACRWAVRRVGQGGAPLPWLLCAAAVALGWGVALLRVHSQPFPGTMFWSFGRYTLVAALPSACVLVLGLRAALPARLRGQATAAQLGFLALFALAALSVFALR
ncbi:hypothetical protein F8S13_17450 [Chloroflexia bacterium SDU3-3]|nr:hypothetical protein F8S13_17450 [Chloroflexia bacterium SDU3-3]